MKTDPLIANIELIKRYRVENPQAGLLEARNAVMDQGWRPGDPPPAVPARTPRDQQNSDYRDKMDCPMENLAAVLKNIGFTQEHVDDEVLVEVATKKLQMMYEMLVTSGTCTETFLKAAMNY